MFSLSFLRIDWSVLPEEFVCFDDVHNAFVTTTKISAYRTFEERRQMVKQTFVGESMLEILNSDNKMQMPAMMKADLDNGLHEQPTILLKMQQMQEVSNVSLDKSLIEDSTKSLPL